MRPTVINFALFETYTKEINNRLKKRIFGRNPTCFFYLFLFQNHFFYFSFLGPELIVSFGAKNTNKNIAMKLSDLIGTPTGDIWAKSIQYYKIQEWFRLPCGLKWNIIGRLKLISREERTSWELIKLCPVPDLIFLN